jgi:predicted metal-dependent HD superfamily phosphohydrolase
MVLTSFQLALRSLVKHYYVTPHRFYHTIEHVDAMLDGYEHYFNEEMSQAEYFAILYHDAVYKPWSSENEEGSAFLMYLHHPNYFPKIKIEVLDAAKEIIMATKHIEGQVVSARCQRVVDLDMMILGKSPDVYDEYVARTRKEYSMYTDEQWAGGRAHVLQQFLDTPRLFLTNEMYTVFEQAARANIERELASLCLSTETA